MSDARKRAADDLGNVIYNIEVGELRAALEQTQEIRAALLAEEPEAPKLHFVCTDFPGPKDECVFVECEDGEGHGVNAGEWVRRPDGLVALVVSRPAPPPLPPEVREAAERHRSTLLSGLAYVARESWWPDDASVTDGVRNHVAKMRDAADALAALVPRGGAE